MFSTEKYFLLVRPSGEVNQYSAESAMKHYIRLLIQRDLPTATLEKALVCRGGDISRIYMYM